MLDIQYIRNHPDTLEKIITSRNHDPSIVEAFLAIDDEYSKLTRSIEELNREKNENALALSHTQDKKSKEAQELIEHGRKIKEEIQARELAQKPLEEKYHTLLYTFPNIYTEDTPIGKDEKENIVIETYGDIPKFSFSPKEHWEIGKDLDIIDAERGAKTSGARFSFLKGALPILEFALVQHVLSIVTNLSILQDILEKEHLNLVPTVFTPIIPPVFITPDVFEKMGRLEPKEDRYYIPSDDLYLIGSAEHTLGSMHMNETFQEKNLPIRYIGFSTAFRREAGSYGKDTRGILRVHQFDKLEMETFTSSEFALDEQLFLVGIQKYIMQSLKIPFQVIRNCSGDMGTPDARQFDIESWLPGQNRYRETHSADYVSDYQSRRLNIKYKKESGQTEFVHMNDATAMAIGRTLIAIIENYQQEDGSVEIPEVLHIYTKGMIPKDRITA